MKFRKKILEYSPQLKNVPAGYKRLGNIMFLRSIHNLEPKLGIIILELFPWCEGVYQYLTTQGISRNPKLKYLAGTKNSIIEHRENGLIYILDFRKIMFSGGNSFLRKKLIEEVKPNEFLVDMFAAVGNLSLQTIYYNKLNSLLIERDPYTFSFLEKTILRNKLDVEVINTDCRNINYEGIADRIFMGFHSVDKSHIEAALKLSKKFVRIHLHPIAKDGNYDEWIDRYSNWIKEFDGQIENIKTYKVKDYSPGLHHIEIEFSIINN